MISPSPILRLPAGSRSARNVSLQLLPTTRSNGCPTLPTSPDCFAWRPPPRPKSLSTAVRPPLLPQFEPALWFDPSMRYGDKLPQSQDPRMPPEQDRKVKLGKTLRIVQQRLPTLLQSPLPKEILAPNITLHLFPSTHPHLPVVSGRVAYIAALWTSPIAWNRIPLISNVEIEILSERMTTSPSSLAAGRQGSMPEQLVVKWRTVGQGKNWNLKWMGTAMPDVIKQDAKKEFIGMFIFEFDAEGRILAHTIENMVDGNDTEKVSKVVGLTDWLLGGMRSPSAACQKTDQIK